MKKNYFGEKYGRLTVIEDLEVRCCDKVLCKCDCGNERSVIISSLKNGNTSSCGCLQKEIRSKITKNIIGEKFGKLLVVEESERIGKIRMFLCRCDCGNIVTVAMSNLTRYHTKSCGCIPSRLPKDLIGKRFGKLTVLKLIPKKGKHRKWLCKCDCGNTTIVSGDSLRAGATVSCGCLKSKAERECKTILSKYKVAFIPQKTFKDCTYKRKLKFDFYISNMNVCIEIDGSQHDHPIGFFGGPKTFEKQKIRDAIKDKYCLDNNIFLLRIPYTKFDKIEEILKENNIIN